MTGKVYLCLTCNACTTNEQRMFYVCISYCVRTTDTYTRTSIVITRLLAKLFVVNFSLLKEVLKLVLPPNFYFPPLYNNS